MLRLGWTRRPDGERDWMADRIAAIAIVLAAIREDRPGGSVARQIGKKGEGKPVLNEAKLRGLLAAETPEELLPEMLTLVRLSGGAVNVADIAESILWWNHPSGRTQRRWLYDYHDIPLASEAAATNNA
jgi:CRISPR system Cascade subunit CasB